MFSYDGKVKEREICEGVFAMPIWTHEAAKANVNIWRKESIKVRDLNPSKTFQLDIESEFLFIFVHY